MRRFIFALMGDEKACIRAIFVARIAQGDSTEHYTISRSCDRLARGFRFFPISTRSEATEGLSVSNRGAESTHTRSWPTSIFGG